MSKFSMNSLSNPINFLKQSAQQIGLVSLAAIGGLVLAQPAQAASLNLTTWDKVGDVQSTAAQANLTNANSDGLDDTPNRNLSSINPLEIDALENALVLPLGTLGLDAYEGSAIKTIFNNVKVGDRLSFNWSFQTFDTLNMDRAFVTINDTLFNLTGTNPFSYTFTGAGNYRIAIGVVDVDDTTGSSILTVNNADLTAVPTPALLPGLIALGLRSGLKRRRISN
jgi:hypothetical protein